MDELETVDIPGVEILKAGRWNGRDYTVTDLQNMVDSFEELKGVYHPFGKLGHNRKQPLLDGFPAVGWVKALRRQGNQLIADFEKVPKRFAQLIKAKAYRERSAEVWFDIKINGRQYPAVLKAVAWLGADPPAVAGLQDVVSMFSEGESHPVSIATLSVEENAVNECPECGADCAECGADCPCMTQTTENAAEQTSGTEQQNAADDDPPSEDEEDDRDPVEVVRGSFKELSGAISKMGTRKKGITELRSILSDASARLDKINLAHNSRDDITGGETLKDEELREILGLDADADIKQSLLSLKSQTVSLSAYERLTEEVEQLKQTNLDRDAVEIVELALKEGKLAPTSRDWAIGYFKKDADGFKQFIEGAPKVVDLTEHGSVSNDTSGAAQPPSDAAVKIAETMGVSAERLSDNRPLDVKLAELKSKV